MFINLQPFLINSHDWFTLLFRVGMALLFGGVLGLDRQLREKPAGLRTYMLVSLGSALFVLIPLQMGDRNLSENALSRVIQGVATGVGFLGAGEIIRPSSRDSSSVTIKGLTSAAAIWVAAVLGILAGCGLWQLGLIGLIAAFLVLTLLKHIEP